MEDYGTIAGAVVTVTPSIFGIFWLYDSGLVTDRSLFKNAEVFDRLLKKSHGQS